MSEFSVNVQIITAVDEHPNADRLELITVKGWQIVGQKEKFKVGDLVVFIPPDAVLPFSLHDFLNITKYCAEMPKGVDGERPTERRVKAARLRGEASYGTLMTADSYFEYMKAHPESSYWNKRFTDMEEGEDVTEFLGIYKWEPPVKSSQGDAERDHALFPKYPKIEHWQNYPEALVNGEEVVMTEKVHGTNCRLGWVKDGEDFIWMAGSHNARRKKYAGLDQTPLPEKFVMSLYWKPYEWNTRIRMMMEAISVRHNDGNVVVYGEIFGSGVQDMAYGLENGNKRFRVFDIRVNETFMNFGDMEEWLRQYEVPLVPILYRGAYSADMVKTMTDGKSTFDVKGKFKGREGVVVRPIIERSSTYLSRFVFKSVSADYLERRTSDGH